MKPNLFEVYKAIQQSIVLEENLINYRLTWSLALSIGLLAINASLLNKIYNFDINNLNVNDYFYVMLALFLSVLVSAIGVFSSIVSWISIKAARDQVSYLKAHYELPYFHDSDGRCVFESEMKLPRPYGGKRIDGRGNLGATSFAFILFIFWVILIIVSFAALLLEPDSFGLNRGGFPKRP